MVRGNLGDHLSVIGRRAERLRLERNDRDGLVVERLGEIGGFDLGPLRHPDLVDWNLFFQQLTKVLTIYVQILMKRKQFLKLQKNV